MFLVQDLMVLKEKDNTIKLLSKSLPLKMNKIQLNNEKNIKVH